MCPELNYEALEVSNGAEAVVAYEALNDLLEYCKLDTWAMVRIFQELEKLVVVPALL